MSKFTTPVGMQVTQEQYEKDLKEPLKKLGYNELVVALCETFPILVNNLFGNEGALGITAEAKLRHNRHFIDHYNPQLFLALAAMTEGKDWIVGEWLVFIKENEIFQCRFLRDANWAMGYAGNYNKHLYRKATKEELINHFTKQNKTDMKKVQDNGKDTSLPIIGYKLIKPEYKYAALAIINETSFRDYTYGGAVDVQQPYNIEKYKNAGVLDIWFTPVYKQQEQIFKVGNFEVKVKDGKAWHGNDDISTFVKGMKETFGTKSFMAGGFKADVKDVIFSKTGCQNSESKLSEWLEVFKALNK